MAKPKNPLLSLGATGTIGDTLTFQKRHQDTIARQKPIPAYRYTLPQAYQRWLYQDYAYLWTQQSESTKRQYAATGSHFHLTGFQSWMKYNLTNLPDIAGMWHLDKISGGSVIDFSKNANHGTVYGATLVDGIIDKALLFDGLDDWIDCGRDPSLYPSSFTFEAWINCPDYSVARGIISVGFNYGAKKGAALDLLTDGSLNFYLADGTDWVQTTTVPALISLSTWHHVAVTFNGSNIEIFVDGVSKKTNTQNPVAYDQTVSAIIGLRWAAMNWFNGPIDHVIDYIRAEDATEILRHSERRYPL